MDFSKFNGLNTETMMALRDHLTKLLEARVDNRPLPGRKAWFINTRTGGRVEVLIERLNHKSVGCRELTPTAGRKWRVPYSMVNVEPTIKTAAGTPAAKPHTPLSVAGDAW